VSFAPGIKTTASFAPNRTYRQRFSGDLSLRLNIEGLSAPPAVIKKPENQPSYLTVKVKNEMINSLEG
jgi:hypothetical protein